MQHVRVAILPFSTIAANKVSAADGISACTGQESAVLVTGVQSDPAILPRKEGYLVPSRKGGKMTDGVAIRGATVLDPTLATTLAWPPRFRVPGAPSIAVAHSLCYSTLDAA
jgi:hypothetical protein